MKRPVRSPLWFGAMALALLVVAWIVAIPRWMPASSASPLSARAAVATRSETDDVDAGDPQRRASDPSTTTKSRAWPRCPGCGVIESVQAIEGSDRASEGADGIERARTRVKGNALDSATSSGTDMRNGYEVTVRFRDGSTTRFDAAAPRLWRVGSLVNVIGAPEARP